jgi:raffinose/stachyose/melibiose transport system permease protein
MSWGTFRILPRRKQPIRQDKGRADLEKTLLITLFFLPGFLLLFLLLIAPIGQATYYSFYKWNGLGALENYVGLANYQRALGHEVFQRAIQHNLVLVVLSLLIQLPLAMSLALILGRGKLRFQRLFRALFFIPFVFSEPITAILWNFVYHPHQGLLNIVTRVMPGVQAQAWLGQQSTVLPAIFFVLTWKFFGFHMLLYMAGLQNVPADVEDAARLDGAKEWQVLRYITLPMMSNTIQLSVFLSILGSLQQFAIIMLMTKGGPAAASEVMVTYLYKFGLQRLSLGYGSAASVILFVICLLFSIGYQRTIMRGRARNL